MLGIIGGSSLIKSTVFAELAAEPRVVDTGEWGKVRLLVVKRKDTNKPPPPSSSSSSSPSSADAELSIVFCQRHEADPACDYTQPGHVNARGIVAAMVQLGVNRVIAFGSTGSCHADRLPVGALAVPDDYFNPFAIQSAFSDYRSHVVPQFDSELRSRLVDCVSAVAQAHDAPLVTADVVYVQSSGPRFETRAEVRWMAQYGHLIGMTCAREATLCCERKLPYALVCTVDNLANGVAHELTFSQFKDGVARNQLLVDEVLKSIISSL